MHYIKLADFKKGFIWSLEEISPIRQNFMLIEIAVTLERAHFTAIFAFQKPLFDMHSTLG